MATRQGNIVDNQNSTYTAVWEGLTDADNDVGTPIGMAEFPIKTVQVVGDFTANGAITIQGSNDGGTTWNTLRDQLGVALVITTSIPRLLGESPSMIRPIVSAGVAVDMDVYITMAQLGSLIMPGFVSDNLQQYAEKTAESTTAIIADAVTIFTVAGGPIKILDLVSYCITDNSAGTQTAKWVADPTVGSATDLSGATADIAPFTAGGIIYNNFTALSTAPVITQTNGVSLAAGSPGLYVPAGVIYMSFTAGGPTDGTFKHYMRYKPLGSGITVS